LAREKYLTSERPRQITNPIPWSPDLGLGLGFSKKFDFHLTYHNFKARKKVLKAFIVQVFNYKCYFTNFSLALKMWEQFKMYVKSQIK